MADHADRAHARAPPREAEAAGRATPGESHEGLQRRAAAREAGYGALLNARPPGPQPAQRAASPNRTGLPDRLKSGIEALSGVSLDGVKVHYNSPRPAELNAHAFAQGRDIHLGPGQERHLPHEAWHVVQQAQRRVKPTQVKGGAPVNDDAGLEYEADVMGARALADAAGRDATRRERAMPSAGPGEGPASRSGYRRGSAPDVAQLRRLAPANTAAAALAGPGTAPTVDRVGPGPASVWTYGVTVVAPQPTRAAALAAVRTEYQSVGAGLGNNFLSVTGIKTLVTANNVVAALVHDTLVGAGALNAPAVALTQPQKRQCMIAAIGVLDQPANLDHLRNLPGLAPVDPVRVAIAATYGAVPQTLRSTVEYSSGLKGYISAVEDTGPQINAKLQDRPNYAGEFPLPALAPYRGSALTVGEVVARTQGAAQDQVPRLASFSNVHHEATVTDVGTQIPAIDVAGSRLDHEAGLDAMTKVIAEGGRFAPVAQLGMAARNDSTFFTLLPVPLGGFAFRSVQFRMLWKRWTQNFHGGYGIAAGAIANALRANPCPGWVTPLAAAPPPTGYHYDLDAPGIH